MFFVVVEGPRDGSLGGRDLWEEMSGIVERETGRSLASLFLFFFFWNTRRGRRSSI